MEFTKNRQTFLIALFTALFLYSAVPSVWGSSASAQETQSDGSKSKSKHAKSKAGHCRSKNKHSCRHTHAAMTMRVQPASFIADVDTGKILESENADSPRYPASLTKMMTLYLTFEELKKGKMRLDQTIPVSEHAASQPQTNIALQPGSRIAVKDAILSIVVRSANDSAVTLGEALGGGSESVFAQKMTQKARTLGMKHTLFYNASGLPDPAQRTTARDMAMLGLALRRDFPQYFPFFKTESFTFHGLTYITHNHVMTRYEGVDGIKTGYIRASGFNVVTSANRNGHHLVAVVLGGSTWKARDDKMIALLDKTFTQLASLDAGKNIHLASAERRRMPLFPAKAESTSEYMEGEGDVPGDEGKPDDVVPAVTAQQQASIAPVQGEQWGIQVGAFAAVTEASAAAANAMKQAPAELNASVIKVSDDNNGAAIHRARLINLTEDQAENACHKLTANHAPCFVYRVN